jgi:predicted O-linked N-acetylglucosamine transferase (SPINDLY family)
MAINPNEIKALRDKIQVAKEQGKLFNTDTFTREFEAALQAVLKGQS